MNLSDPILWICIGILLFGALFLVWAIGKLRGPKFAESPRDVLAEGIGADVTDIDFSIDTLDGPSLGASTLARPPARAPAAASAPPLNKEIADRLENLTQRLSDMQSVLSKQSGTPSLATSPGGGGPGFSPETVDKLLKIIGNVIQQVDLLQRSLNIAKPDAASSAPAATIKPAAPRPMVSPLGSPMGPLSAVKKTPAPGPGPSGTPPSGLPKI